MKNQFVWVFVLVLLVGGFWWMNRNQTSDKVVPPLEPISYANNPGGWKNFKKPSEAQLKATLTPLQFAVTQKEGTEDPYNNEYVHSKEEGIYVDIVSGEPIFSSKDKYDSNTGWPSFVQPITPDLITTREDTHLGYARVEVRSRYADSHLGHVFDDGPADRGGKRYCMNSAALRFVPKADMAAQGYGEYLAALE